MKTLVCNNFNRLVETSPLTKREIAKGIGVSENTLQRWKNAESYPELPNIEKLAKLLKVSPLEFYQDEKPIVKILPIKDVVRMMAAIPDDIYVSASEFELNHPVWDEIRSVIKNAKIDGHNTVNHPPKKNHS